MPRIPTSVLALVLASVPATAQVYVTAPGQLPAGSPGNASTTENVDFADIDLDGDFDVVCADGGDDGNDRNRLWINQGGLQGGTVGVFVDETGAQYPGGGDSSRDVEFADLDADGDADLVVSNHSTQVDQGSRILINQGGLQAGTAGFFVDETSTRWVNVWVNDGLTTFSSVAPSLVLPGGGFKDWSYDDVLADLDGDGDPDLLHTSYGPIFSGTVPSRVFLNDGLGHFEEFNPSGYQLAGQGLPDGAPALWAAGQQQQGTLNATGLQADVCASTTAAEAGDLDGDFDLDLLLGSREGQPRLFRNELGPGGLAPFLDLTGSAYTQLVLGGGNYEQELGDFDQDDDLDLYGVNWMGNATFDGVARNDGAMTFGAFTQLPNSSPDDEEAEFLDYDADGDLDVYVTNFSGQDRLYENTGAPAYGYHDVTATAVPTLVNVTRGLDSADVDLDGDMDVLVASDNGVANVLLINQSGAPDTHAPRVLVEPVDPPACGAGPVRVRAAVYDNASWEWQRYDVVELEYLVDGGTPQSAAMRYSGGQLWWGELPANTVGSVTYRARATDWMGNSGVSLPRQVALSPVAVNYCTAGTSASGCQALLSSTGTPSATGASGFLVQAGDVEGSKQALYYWGTSGRQANPWGNGTSWRCVELPVFRSAPLVSSGAAGTSDGTVAFDLTARWQEKPASNPGAGPVTQLQLWYRDPQSTSNQTTSLSDALEFTTCP
jgi:hypothetical protein